MTLRSLQLALPLLAAAAFATGCHSTHADPKKVTASTEPKQEETHNLIRFVKNPDPAPALGFNDLSIYELEVRALLGLPFDGKVDYFDDTGQVFLKNAEKATELPGVDLSKLTPAQKTIALRRFNAESCTCGCKMTLAQCRVNDTGCSVSKEMTAKIISELSHAPVKTAAPEK